MAKPSQRPSRQRWTSFVAEDSPDGRPVRGLHEQANPRHRLRVEHDQQTLLIHLSDEDGTGWTTIAVDRTTRQWAVAQADRQSDSARDAYTHVRQHGHRIAREGQSKDVTANTAPQDRITAFWDAIAKHYDSPENVPFPDTAAYTQWVDALRTVLPDPPARVLDVGTGTGFVARIAAELGHEVTAIDLSAAMIEAAAERGSARPVTFTVGDAVDPRFPRGSIDAVVSRSVLWTLREPEKAFRSWYELLRPGGRVVAIYGLAHSRQDSPAPDADATSEDRHFFEQYYTAETQAALPAIHLSDHEVVVRAATAAGFRDVSTTALEMVRGWETSPGSDLPYALVGFRPPA